MPDRAPLPYRFHVKRKLRAEIEAVLEPGESVQTFVEKAIAFEIARRRRALGKDSPSEYLITRSSDNAHAADQRPVADGA